MKPVLTIFAALGILALGGYLMITLLLEAMPK